jgi:hypothetical protein
MQKRVKYDFRVGKRLFYSFCEIRPGKTHASPNQALRLQSLYCITEFIFSNLATGRKYHCTSVIGEQIRLTREEFIKVTRNRFI